MPNHPRTPTHSETPHPGAPVVEIDGLCKSYDGRVVVDDLSMTVRPGEVVGLIGANGAGKTTTVEIIQGLRHADAGHVRVLGLHPRRDAARLRPLLGSQLQSSALPDRMRVGEAVALFAQPRPGRPMPDGDALLERFGLAHRRRYAFGSMSGGERQRLFLVLALLNTPRLVILDELTQGLDPTARRDVWAAVDQLRDVGTTVLLVTHELAEAEALCDRVIAMRDGKVLAEGTPAELVRRFAGAATVSFTWTPGGHLELARDLHRLNAIVGVTRVRRDAGRVIVDGDVPVIAHVGAWLAASGRPIPPDLRVDQPGLEDALLTLLDSPRAA